MSVFRINVYTLRNEFHQEKTYVYIYLSKFENLVYLNKIFDVS